MVVQCGDVCCDVVVWCGVVVRKTYCAVSVEVVEHRNTRLVMLPLHLGGRGRRSRRSRSSMRSRRSSRRSRRRSRMSRKSRSSRKRSRRRRRTGLVMLPLHLGTSVCPHLCWMK